MLDPETDAVTIYIISSTGNAEGYAKGLMSYFDKGFNKIKPLPKLRFVAVPILMYLQVHSIDESNFYIKHLSLCIIESS